VVTSLYSIVLALSVHVNAVEQGVDFQCSSERSLIYGMNANSSKLLLRMLVLCS